MKLIVGLGNPGEKYENSRHNMGFVMAQSLLHHLESVKNSMWDMDKKGKAEVKQVHYKNQKFLLARPHTFMNNSGFSVQYLADYYKIEPQDIAVIYDELDLPLGKIRVRFGGAAGGHRGVESIIEHLKTDKFLRIRLGIGHPHHHAGKLNEGKSHIAVEDYVLQQFASNEKSKVRHMIKEATKTLCLILEHGIDTYMSKYNGEGKKEDKISKS